MELESLLSFVRYQRGQKAGWDALDEVLTAVQESDAKVKAANEKVAAAESKLAELDKQYADKLAHAEARLAGVEAGIAEKKKAYLADIAKIDDAAKIEQAKVSANLASMELLVEKLKVQGNGLAGEIQLLHAEKDAAEKDLARVKDALAEISKSIAR